MRGVGLGSRWHADVFVPELGMLGDKASHEQEAALIIDDAGWYAFSGEPIFAAYKRTVFADNHARNAMKDRGSGAHRARRKG